MDRRTFLLNMCRHADGTVDGARFAHLCNRWSPQARASSIGVRMARYGSGFAPAARAAAAVAAKARGGVGGGNPLGAKVMAPGGRGGFIEAGGQAPGAEPRGNVPPSKVMAPGGRDGFIAAGGQSPASAKGIRAPGPSAPVPGPGAGGLEGKEFLVYGSRYYVKDGVLTKAWSDGGTQSKQGGRGGKFLPRETESGETARNLEILRKAGVVLPDGSGGVKPDDRRRYMR